MELPNAMLNILIPVIFVAAGLALVAYLTKGSRNFRSRRNKKARKQF